MCILLRIGCLILGCCQRLLSYSEQKRLSLVILLDQLVGSYMALRKFPLNSALNMVRDARLTRYGNVALYPTITLQKAQVTWNGMESRSPTAFHVQIRLNTEYSSLRGETFVRSRTTTDEFLGGLNGDKEYTRQALAMD